MLKVKEGFMLSPLGEEYVVVSVGKAAEAFNGMIRLNTPGAFLWQCIQDGMDTREKLTKAMLERYDDLNEATAAEDLDEFLDSIKVALED